MLSRTRLLERMARSDDPDLAAEAKAEQERQTAAKAKAKAARKARPVRAVGPTKAAKKATKRGSDAIAYAGVRERDAGLCTVQLAAEILGVCGGALQIDHQWGRGKAPTTVENCRMLCRDHHRRKTDSETEQGPSRLLWLCDFREHALSHDYYAEVSKADGAIALERGQHPDRRAPVVAIRLEVKP